MLLSTVPVMHAAGHLRIKNALREALSNYSDLSYPVQLVRNLMLLQVSSTAVWQSSSSGCSKDLVRRYPVYRSSGKKSWKGRVTFLLLQRKTFADPFCKGSRAVFAWKQCCVEGVMLLVWNAIASDSPRDKFHQMEAAFWYPGVVTICRGNYSWTI